MKPLSFPAAAVLALLLCSLAAGQVSHCAAPGSPQLRFVAQLSVSGCALFVHDMGASDGPHLAVEPVMCVMDRLDGLMSKFDPITEQLYVSVPVMVKDESILAEAQLQLRNLSSKPLRFAAVTNVSVETDLECNVRPVGFIWSPNESEGFLRLAFRNNSFELGRQARETALSAMSCVSFVASVTDNDTQRHLCYRPSISNGFIELNALTSRYTAPQCNRMRFIRSVNLESCIARVHQRLDIKGYFLIEPLLCHNISSLSSESVMFDYSRDKHYLKLDLVLQDEATLDAVSAQLADLSPRSVSFMKLWRAQSIVSSALSSRFSIGPLMVSTDWRSAQLRLLCRSLEQCSQLRVGILLDAVNLWRHIKWQVTSVMEEKCIVKSNQEHFRWRMKETTSSANCSSRLSAEVLDLLLRPSSSVSKFVEQLRDGRCFVKIQQRLADSTSFQRPWSEYESGFGDELDFWIGLSAIHSLSAGGTTLRVEMKLSNGTELHAEFAGFQVGNASTKYVMTYREMLGDRYSVGHNALWHSNGTQFSTIESYKDDVFYSTYFSLFGDGGWWGLVPNPNGLLNLLRLREVRLLLQM